MCCGVQARLARINVARTGRQDGGGEGMCAHLTRAESLPDHCHWQSSSQQHQNTAHKPQLCAQTRVSSPALPLSRVRDGIAAMQKASGRRVAGQLARREGAPRTHLRCYPRVLRRAGVVGASRAHAAPRVLVLVGGPQPSAN
jgi:hypothetical protein